MPEGLPEDAPHTIRVTIPPDTYNSVRAMITEIVKNPHVMRTPDNEEKNQIFDFVQPMTPEERNKYIDYLIHCFFEKNIRTSLEEKYGIQYFCDKHIRTSLEEKYGIQYLFEKHIRTSIEEKYKFNVGNQDLADHQVFCYLENKGVSGLYVKDMTLKQAEDAALNDSRIIEEQVCTFLQGKGLSDLYVKGMTLKQAEDAALNYSRIIEEQQVRCDVLWEQLGQMLQTDAKPMLTQEESTKGRTRSGGYFTRLRCCFCSK